MRSIWGVALAGCLAACASEPATYVVPNTALLDEQPSDAVAAVVRTLALEGFQSTDADYAAGTVSASRQFGNGTAELQEFFQLADCGLQTMQLPDGGSFDIIVVVSPESGGSRVDLSTSVALSTTPSAANRVGSNPATFSCNSRGSLERRILDRLTH